MANEIDIVLDATSSSMTILEGDRRKIIGAPCEGLSKEEAYKMRRDVALRALEDKRKREKIEMRNNPDGAVHLSDKIFRDNFVKFSESYGLK